MERPGGTSRSPGSRGGRDTLRIATDAELDRARRAGCNHAHAGPWRVVRLAPICRADGSRRPRAGCWAACPDVYATNASFRATGLDQPDGRFFGCALYNSRFGRRGGSGRRWRFSQRWCSEGSRRRRQRALARQACRARDCAAGGGRARHRLSNLGPSGEPTPCLVLVGCHAGQPSSWVPGPAVACRGGRTAEAYLGHGADFLPRRDPARDRVMG